MTSFYVFLADQLPGICTLEEIENVERDYEASRGVARANDWPDDALMRMNRNQKKDVGLADVLFAPGHRVVSKRLREAIEAAGEPTVEFLPITIMNHKDRVASRDYAVMNPLRIVDCIDVAASRVRWNAIDPSMISSVAALVLVPSAVPPAARVFRPKSWQSRVLIRKDLADELTAKGFTGMYFRDPLDFRG